MLPSSPVRVLQADLSLPEHQAAVVELVNAYAMDPMGNGRPLDREVKEALIPGLRSHPTTLIFLAWEEMKPVGIAVCFLGFSTFATRPLLNIHDLAVLPEHRGKAIGRMLLAEVEMAARARGCCKLTLEVLENNHGAIKMYQAAGFAPAVYREAAGRALFLAKPLSEKRDA